ncbi:MAG: LPXTG cell wall anchor domain-containing protein [Saccharofermentanales bacterium]
MKVIPNASVSWDPRAWSAMNKSETSPFYTFDLAHYKKELEWMKNEFKTPVIDPAGDKLIMLDNWNEFGEGHYVMPSYNIPAYNKGTVGFGYLDVIREVFRTVPFDLLHKDINPVENGFGPYDKWYPPAWTQQNKPDFPVPVDNSIKFGSSASSQNPTNGISGDKSSGGFSSGNQQQSQTNQSALSGSQPGSTGSQGDMSGSSEGISGNSIGASSSIDSTGDKTGAKNNLLIYALIVLAALILLAAVFYIIRKKKIATAKTHNGES